MKLATFRLTLVTLVMAATANAGCARIAQPPPPAAVPVAQIVEPAAPSPDEWNVFPDPLSGNVEVYHNGESIGSITGDEKEDPPLPHPTGKEDSDQ